MRCGDCFSEMIHKDGYWECPNCGWNIVDDEVEDFDIDEYRADKQGHVLDFDDVPEGCAACGGDYPNCKDACPLFD